MILIRRLLGDVLRRKRQDEGRTLRQLAADARISPGYLSEIERGQKEPSSELLAAICVALDMRLSELLREVSIELASAELAAQFEAERLGAVAVPGARVAAPPARTGTAVKTVPLAKPVARTALRPGIRPATRPVARRMQPPAPVSSNLSAANLGGSGMAAGNLGGGNMTGVLEALGHPEQQPAKPLGTVVLAAPILLAGDLALR
jgi:transcriptional regulator with XRE-family HTH domain